MLIFFSHYIFFKLNIKALLDPNVYTSWVAFLGILLSFDSALLIFFTLFHLRFSKIQ